MDTHVVQRVVGPVVGLLLCAGVAACTGADDVPAPPRPSAADALDFGVCPDSVDTDNVPFPAGRREHLTFTCATLVVPLDHAEPDGETLELAVMRVTSDEQGERIGSLVLNPGGPGQSGLDYLPSWATWLSDEVLARFDVVTFDPRGTGRSGPVNCGHVADEDEPRRTLDLARRAGWRDVVKAHDRFTAACLARMGDTSRFFTTQETALDLEDLRAALGDQRLTFVGFSYGASLGGEYARQFPERVRALVLDAPGDPGQDTLAETSLQVRSFEAAFGAWARDCPNRPTCADIAADPTAYVHDLVARADAEPILSFRPGDHVPAGGGDVLWAVASLLYDDRSWSALDAALTEAVRGDSGSMFEILEHFQGPRGLDAPDDPSPADAAYVINCNDRPPGPPAAAVRAAARDLQADLPVFGTWGGQLLYGCRGWPVERTVLAPPRAPDAPPLLVVGSRHDPATPYAGARRFTEALGGSGHLLTSERDGHTAYGRSACVNDLVDAYLIDLVVPREGTTCAAD